MTARTYYRRMAALRAAATGTIVACAVALAALGAQHFGAGREIIGAAAYINAMAATVWTVRRAATPRRRAARRAARRTTRN